MMTGCMGCGGGIVGELHSREEGGAWTRRDSEKASDWSLQIWKITIFNWKTHYKWPFSIAMLNYQRVWFIMVYHLVGGLEHVFIFHDIWHIWGCHPSH